MPSPHDLAPHVAAFLHDYRFNDWMGCNPSHEPLAAKRRRGLYVLIRIAVPAVGRARDAVIAEGVRLAGYEVREDVSGVYLEKSIPASG